MSDLKTFIKTKIKEGISTSLKTENEKIYAFSMYVNDEDDDPRCPTIQFGYNTEEQYNDQIKRASSKEEARWNYAFWKQNFILTIGEHTDTPENKRLISNWIYDLGLYYTDEEEDEDFDLCLDKGCEITAHFIDLLMEIVHDIQAELNLKQPILIHELEYYSAIAEQNIEANGKERVQGLCDWINSMYTR